MVEWLSWLPYKSSFINSNILETSKDRPNTPTKFKVIRAKVYDQNFQGDGVVDGEGGSSEGCLKWGDGGLLRDPSKNILKQGVGKGKSCS